MASARVNRCAPNLLDSTWVPTRWVTENRVGPDAPRLVVISTTPFAADEP